MVFKVCQRRHYLTMFRTKQLTTLKHPVHNQKTQTSKSCCMTCSFSFPCSSCKLSLYCKKKKIKSYTYFVQICIKATWIKQKTFQKLRAQDPLKTTLFYCLLQCSAKDSSAAIFRIRKKCSGRKKNKFFNSLGSFVQILVYSHETEWRNNTLVCISSAGDIKPKAVYMQLGQ